MDIGYYVIVLAFLAPVFWALNKYAVHRAKYLVSMELAPSDIYLFST